MTDTYPYVSPPLAHRIEVLNFQNQMNLVEGLVETFLDHHGPDGKGKAPPPDEAALLALHRACTQLLLADAGQYRTGEVVVRDAKGTIVYKAPEAHQVPTLVQKFFRELQSFWPDADPLKVASYTLWRINWIHPFANGNGRTARAFSYTCMCIKSGLMLPGREIMIDLIRNVPEYYNEYLDALKCADENPGLPNLDKMSALLDKLAEIQYKSRYHRQAHHSAPIPK